MAIEKTAARIRAWLQGDKSAGTRSPARSPASLSHDRFTEEQINAAFAQARREVDAREGKIKMISTSELPAYQAEHDVVDVLHYGDSGICRIRYKPKGAPPPAPARRVLRKNYSAEEINDMFAKAREAVEAREGKTKMIPSAELPAYQAEFEVVDVLEYGDSGICRIRYKPKAR